MRPDIEPVDRKRHTTRHEFDLASEAAPYLRVCVSCEVTVRKKEVGHGVARAHGDTGPQLRIYVAVMVNRYLPTDESSWAVIILAYVVGPAWGPQRG